MDIVETSSSHNTDQSIDIQQEQSGEYRQEILIDRKKLKQIQKEGFSLVPYDGFQVGTLEKLGIKPRKHHLYYGLNLQERALVVSLTSNRVMIPLLTKKDLEEKLQKINPEIRNTIGWLHIGAIQIIIKSTFKEGLDTPIDLAIMDNRIRNMQEALHGVLRGNLKYQKLKFNIHPRISYHLQDKDFDKTLSLIQDFKRKEFFYSDNRPYSITYMLSYAISNTHHSDCFKIKDIIEYPYLFNDVSQVQFPSLPQIMEIDQTPLNLDLSHKPLLTSSSHLPRLSFQDNRVISSPADRTLSLPRINQIIAKNDQLSNYKIKGEYFNGNQFIPVDILIDTGANGNYINHKLCDNLQRFRLDTVHKYTNFNGEEHVINEVVDTTLKFGSETIPIRLLIENEGFNDLLQIMLGVTFLDSVKPYKITAYGIQITYQDKVIYIPK
jgi:hypothetical protein